MKALIGSLCLLGMMAAGGEIKAAPFCERVPQSPICQCQGTTGTARVKCLRCANNPNAEGCRDESVSGTVRPRYLILTIVYSPPGAGEGGTRSSVSYSTGSTTGTALSIERAFRKEVETRATASLLKLLEVGVSGSYSSSVTDAKSVEIKKSATDTIVVQGGSSDGINHDLDLFYLWLNPLVGIVARDNNAQWALGTDGPAMRIQVVSVGQLKNPATMPPGVARELRAAGLTPRDYEEILSQNPFSRGTAAIDANRYRQTNLIYPYEPPFEEGSPGPTWQTQIRSSILSQSSSVKTTSYSVGASVSAGPFAKWFGAKVTASARLTWTNTSRWSTSNDQTQSATLTVASPSYGYSGPTAMAVYWDTLYGSFMFAPAPLPSPTATGKIVDANGKPVPHKEILLRLGGRQWRTFTNQRGEYRFFGTPSGRGSIEVRGAARQQVLLRDRRSDLGAIKIAP